MFKGTGRELTRFVGSVSATVHKHIASVRGGPGFPAPVPAFVDEVWEGSFGPEERIEPFWHWEGLYPAPPEVASEPRIDLAAIPELAYLSED